MTLIDDRAALHRVVLVQVERRVEELETEVYDLTKEVGEIDFEPSYTCDCACDTTISDLEDDVQNAYRRIEALEKLVYALTGVTQLPAD